jgi:hypothetical protein
LSFIKKKYPFITRKKERKERRREEGRKYIIPECR